MSGCWVPGLEVELRIIFLRSKLVTKAHSILSSSSLFGLIEGVSLNAREMHLLASCYYVLHSNFIVPKLSFFFPFLFFTCLKSVPLHFGSSTQIRVWLSHTRASSGALNFHPTFQTFILATSSVEVDHLLLDRLHFIIDLQGAQHAAERPSSLGADGSGFEPIKLSNMPSWSSELQFETWPAGVEISRGKRRKPTKASVATFCSMHNDYYAVVKWAAELPDVDLNRLPENQCR